MTLMGPTRSNISQRKMWDSLFKYYSIFLFFYLNAPHSLTLFSQVLNPKRNPLYHVRKPFQLAFISFLDQKVGGGDNAKETQWVKKWGSRWTTMQEKDMIIFILILKLIMMIRTSCYIKILVHHAMSLLS